MKCCSCDQTPSHHYYLHPHLSLSTSRWQLFSGTFRRFFGYKGLFFPMESWLFRCSLSTSFCHCYTKNEALLYFFVRRWVVKVLPWGHFGKLSLIILKISVNSQLISDSEQHLSSSGITMKEWYWGNIYGPLYILNFQTNISKC